MFLQHFRWVPAEWNSCSKTCGRGKQRRKILCHQRISKTLDKKIKKSNCKSLPKPARTRRCNLKECPPVWRAGKWNKVGSVKNLRVLRWNISSCGRIFPLICALTVSCTIFLDIKVENGII